MCSIILINKKSNKINFFNKFITFYTKNKIRHTYLVKVPPTHIQGLRDIY